MVYVLALDYIDCLYLCSGDKFGFFFFFQKLFWSKIAFVLKSLHFNCCLRTNY